MNDMEEEDSYDIAVKKQRKRLWIDKYCSKNFLDLMSDDLSNRKVLSWMILFSISQQVRLYSHLVSKFRRILHSYFNHSDIKLH